MADLKAIQIESDLRTYGFLASPSFLAGVERYIDLLLRWNRTISLTTVVDPDQIVRFHFGESILALSAVPIENGRLADVGSGAGFPGLALAMARPGLQVTLVEASAKKFSFLSEAVRELDLKNARVLRCRMEEVAVEERFDFTTARALGQHDLFLKWSELHLKSAGTVVLWLGRKHVASLRSEGGWNWSPEVSIPASKQRFLLFGSPQH
jgi:16S rRNA (guanine527-N7)-methyltransferase